MNTQADIQKATEMMLAELLILSTGSRWPEAGMRMGKSNATLLRGGNVRILSDIIPLTRAAHHLYFEDIADCLRQAVELGLKQTQHRIDSLEKKAERARRIIEVLSEDD